MALLTIAASLVFPLVIPMQFGWIFQVGALLAGVWFLVLPGVRWLRDQQTKSAMLFFNRACFYPLAVFGAAGVLSLL